MRSPAWRTSHTPAAPASTELIACLLLCVVILLALTPLAAQALVMLVLTGDLAWPHDMVAAVRGLADGRFGGGLDPGAAEQLPGFRVMVTVSFLAETMVLAGLVAVGRTPLTTAGAGVDGESGLASPRAATRALGVGPLRHRRRTIRPDLGRRPLLTTENLTAWRQPSDSPPHLRAGRPHGPRIWWSAVRPDEIGWWLGTGGRVGPSLWVPYDRTTCVIGPQGSGKTMDLLAPALLNAPGAALVTLTKPDDLFLTISSRQRTRPRGRGPGRRDASSRGGRPVAVLDPFDLAPGSPRLVWDPIAGCGDPMLAERRARAFAAGTIRGATAQSGDQAARFYAGECAKVLQAYFHAAALTGATLDDLLEWVANPRHHVRAEEVLRTHPDATPHWDGLLRGALHGDERTAGNTITTLQQSLALFFQPSIRARCLPSSTQPATDLADLIRKGGTIYLLGREDPYASASPLMTAVAEDVLDTAKHLGETSPHGRLCPPFLACLDELPSTAPLPTLSTRMANERALGLSFILAAQTWRQLCVCYGEDEARTILGLSNNLVLFGGGKDIGFYREMSDLLGDTVALRAAYTRDRHGTARSWNPADTPILRPADLRRIPPHRALVIAETNHPLLARLRRCLDGRTGRRLATDQRRARTAAATARAESERA